MKILAGVVHCDTGTIRLQDEEVEFRTPRDALEHGVSTVFQELSLLPNLTIAENMFLGNEPLTRLGRIDYRRMEVATRNTLARLGLALEPRAIVSRLSIAQQQFVEIARGLNADADLIVLDEPTAALNAADVSILNKQIRGLAEEGKSIIYISHRLEEIFEVCDTVTILKDGKNVTTAPVRDLTPHQLIGLMVGRDIEDLFPHRAHDVDDPVLTVNGLRLTDGAKPISFAVAKGEIVALAGLEGQGQHEIVRALVGQYQPVAGSLTINGTIVNLPVRAADGVRKLQSLGVGFMPEDRQTEGLFPDLPIDFNIALGLYSRYSDVARAHRYRDVVLRIMETLGVQASPDARVSSLSGGNQQKTLLGRYLATEVGVLIIEEPTRGVDIGAKAEIYRLLREFADRGGAVLVLSRETVELIGLSDRLYVIHGKTIVSELAASDATEHKILGAALSGAAHSAPALNA